MTELKFSYEPWDNRRDQRVLRESTDRAVGLVRNDIEFITEPDDKVRKREFNPVVSEVTALLAETLDWLRKNGVSSEDVQQGVARARNRNLSRQPRIVELRAQKLGIFEAPDIHRKGESLPKTKKPVEV